jgi:hypothetical protein
MINVYGVPTGLALPEAGHQVIEMQIDASSIDFVATTLGMASKVHMHRAGLATQLRMVNSEVIDIRAKTAGKGRPNTFGVLVWWTI